MNSVSGIFVAISLIFGGGYAADKIYMAVKRTAIQQVHAGMPSLSAFTNRMTCSKISDAGTLVSTKCQHIF